MSLTRSLIPQQHRPILDQLLVRLSLRQGQAKRIPTRSQSTLEELLERQIIARSRFRSAAAIAGGKARKVDPLQQFIEQAVMEIPTLQLKELIKALEKISGGDLIDDIQAEYIHYHYVVSRRKAPRPGEFDEEWIETVISKKASLDGVRSRLTRARKRIAVSHSTIRDLAYDRQ
jgi:hypothetical protein